MKKVMIGLLTMMFVFAFLAQPVHADANEVLTGMGGKFFRGVVNVFTGWVEIPAQIVKGYNRDSAGGAILGIFRGVYHAIGRTVSGAGEMTGFWAADPDTNSGIGIPLDAEYAWEEGTPYSMIDPNFTDATLNPMGNKLLRGLGNALFGFVEVPGQISKGIKEKAPDAGLIKGIWFFLSREMDGAVDVASFFLPNPAENKGYPFDEKWPWSAMGDSMQK